MRLTTAALCESAHERPDGRIDLIGVFHELNAPGFPAVQEHMTAVFVVEWDAAETGPQPLRADLLAPNGRKVLTIEGHTEVSAQPGGGPPQTRLIMPLEKVVFPVTGLYQFELLAGTGVVRACPLRLLQVPAA
ncbi:MAG TPA: hypothetical protein VK939_07285 [Longimicrobiales bacterium]|nr:hypothetical protein [Longimicrobiales bacterium]